MTTRADLPTIREFLNVLGINQKEKKKYSQLLMELAYVVEYSMREYDSDIPADMSATAYWLQQLNFDSILMRYKQ